MALRTFVDANGLEWQAFNVVPREEERRQFERRSSMRPLPVDRRDGDRRVTIGGATRLSKGGEGWLCFERGTERRRLSPIPADWTGCSDARLEEYRQQARPARTSTSVQVQPPDK